jgi:hypothetical protein
VSDGIRESPLDSMMESDAQQVVTFEAEPSLQPTLVAFSSRGRC